MTLLQLKALKASDFINETQILQKIEVSFECATMMNFTGGENLDNEKYLEFILT